MLWLILVIALVFLFRKELFGSNDDFRQLNIRIEHLEQKIDFLHKKIDLLEQDKYETQQPDTSASQHSSVLLTTSSSTETEGIAKTLSPVIDETVPLNVEEPLFSQPSDFSPSIAVSSSSVPSVNDSPVWRSAKTEPTEQDNIRDRIPSLSERIWHWLIEGNPMLKVGAIVLFLGLAFLLRFASEHFSFSVEARYLSVTAIGIVCGIIGWRVRNSHREYGLTMQGMSVAILYLTVLATLKLHNLLPPLWVFMIQVGLVALMIGLAVLQNARILARVALIGGLASPILIYEGSGNHIILFTYLTLLNTGVAGVAWFKSWRSLNIIGATGTFAIASAWISFYYIPQYFLTGQLFLIFHTALYTFIVWRFAQHKNAENQEYIIVDNNADLERVFSQWWQNMRYIGVLDSGLLFGVAFAAFSLQTAMVSAWQYGAICASLGLAVFYALFGYFILRASPTLKVMADALFFLALVFLTLAIGNGFESWNRTTLWAIEAGLIYWFGIRQQLPLSRFIAVNLFIAAWMLDSLYRANLSVNYSFLNSILFVLVGVAFYAIWCIYRMSKSATWELLWINVILIFTFYSAFMIPYHENVLKRLSDTQSFLLTLGIALVCAVEQRYRRNIVLVIATILTLFCAINYYSFYTFTLRLILSVVAGISAWCLHHPRWLKEKLPLEQQIAGVIGLIYMLFAFGETLGELTVFQNKLGLMRIFLLAFMLLMGLAWFLRWKQARTMLLTFIPLWILISFFMNIFVSRNSLSYFFILIWALAIHITIMYILHRHISDLTRTTWHSLGLNTFVFYFTALLIEILQDYQATNGWFMSALALVSVLAVWLVLKCRHILQKWQLDNIYLNVATVFLIVYLMVWVVIANVHSTALSLPLPYIPLLNPLELTSLLSVYVTWQWSQITRQIEKNLLIMVLSSLTLFMLTLIAIRMWYHYGDLEWRFSSMMQSFALQATLSVIWAVSAIILMLQGNRQSQRKLWFSGAILMGVVVLKLFLIELGDSGGIARIVSFIVVGLLLLLVGYFAPIPPKAQIDIKEQSQIKEQEEMTSKE